MKKIYKKIIVVLAVLMLVPPIVIAKNNSSGEDLNLKPYVDFEVKEKQKVDIIVDIGNAAYTENDINSILNTNLKPQLAAKGLDYNIIVKNTNEGADHFYFEYYYNIRAANDQVLSRHGGIFKYDMAKRQAQQVEDTRYYDARVNSMSNGYNFGNHSPFYYDTKNNALVNIASQYFQHYDLTRKINTIGWQYTDRNISLNTMYADGSVMRLESKPDNEGRWEHISTYELYRNNNVYQYRQKQNIGLGYSWNSTNGDRFLKDYYLSPQGELLTVHTSDRSTEYHSSASLGKISNTTGGDTFGSETYLQYNLMGGSPMYYYDDEHIIIYRRIEGTINANPIPQAYKLNTSTFELTRMESLDHHFEKRHNGYSASGYNKFTLGTFSRDKKQFIDLRTDGIYTTPRVGTSYTKIASYPTGLSQPQQKGFFGSYVLMVLYEDTLKMNGKFYLFNIETKEFIFVTDLKGESYVISTGNREYQAAGRSLTFYQFPINYEVKKYLVSDIIKENNSRYDADTYYIRIDDLLSEQFMNPTQSAEIANLLSSNNMTFIGIGSSEAKPYHDNMLATLDGNGKAILNSNNITQALIEATNYIVNKKEVDLHVINTGSTNITQTDVKTIIDVVKRDMRATNHIVKTYSHYSEQADLYDTITNLEWNDNKNTFVVIFNEGHIIELQDEYYQQLISTTLDSHSAHLIYISNNTQDETLIENIVSLNNSNGYRQSPTQANQVSYQLKEYITNKALTNPAKHIKKLILQHNPTTNEYSSEIDLQAYYFDEENDRKKGERFKTEHNPTVYENHTGLMAGTGTYMNSAITRFTKVGKYDIVVQMQDDPTNQVEFQDEYSLWSEDSLSRLVLYVHRQPVAHFQAYTTSNNEVIINDFSYDLDHYSYHAKGIIQWQWKYKKATDSNWTEGKPTQLQANTAYMISLKVKDVDEAWSNEKIVVLGIDQPPVALFDFSHAALSWTKNPTITDHSYSPSGRNIASRAWNVYREGQLVTTSSSTTLNLNTVKSNAQAQFGNTLGEYTIELVVTDSAGLTSSPYQNKFEWINYAPIPLFQVVQPLYRDSLLEIDNNTTLLDLDEEPTSFNWTFKKGTQSFTSTLHTPSNNIKDFGVGKAAVGKWEVTLAAKDTLNQEGKLTKEVVVLNHVPTSSIVGADIGYLNQTYTYQGQADDEDSEDQASLKSYWKVTSPDGQIQQGYNLTYALTTTQKGSYTIEHWVVDQLDSASPINIKKLLVANTPPIAQFLLNKASVFRNEEVQVRSTSYDTDGYIAKYQFDNENSTGVSMNSVLEQEFSMKLSVPNLYRITHTVTDNDGATATVTEMLEVVNRIPKTSMVYPDSTNAQKPTLVTSATPIFEWNYVDEDSDEQIQAELKISELKDNGLANEEIFVRTKHYTGKDTRTRLDHITLEEGEIYLVEIRAFDGYDWGDWSPKVYFNIQLNSPPEAGFSFTPQTVYEGDTISIYHQVDDSDDDELQVSYVLKTESGHSFYFPLKDSSYRLQKQQYNSFAFNYKGMASEIVEITQTVTDGSSTPVKMKSTISYLPLTLTADVQHTEIWESYRQSYNANLKQSERWQSKQFYAGEKFILVANTTAFDYGNTDTSVKVDTVTAYFPFLDLTIPLKSEQSADRFRGELYIPELSKLKNGFYDFQFSVHYSNAITKKVQVQIEIIGEAISFIGVHRLK